jgi:hypothetical protein
MLHNLIGCSLCLHELRKNPPGADLDRAATPKGCVPGTARIKNLAANLERSPLTHSYGYGSAGDRSTLFAKFPLSFVPFMQHAG